MKLSLKTIALILTLTLWVSVGAAAGEMQILTPADRSVLGSEWASLVLEIGTDSLDEVRVAVNDGRELSITRFSDGHVLCWDGLRLSGGMNRVRIVGWRDGRPLAKERLEVFYKPELAEENLRPPAGFKRSSFHGSQTERTCLLCHSTGPEAGGKASCGGCHGKIAAAKFVHGPAAVSSCLMCHEEGSGRPLAEGPQEQIAMCGDCHADSMELWKGKKYWHGPASFGSCTMCHDPHGAGNPYFLRLNPTDLCLACHSGVAERPHVITAPSGGGHPLRGDADPARPGEPFSCASCHNPHAGDTPYFLNRYEGGSLMKFCLSCHKMR